LVSTSRLDEIQRERFHPLSIQTHFKEPEGWLIDYSFNEVKGGKDCCSEESITFHYVSPEEMVFMHSFNRVPDLISNLTSI
jgi:hypothetical protein